MKTAPKQPAPPTEEKKPDDKAPDAVQRTKAAPKPAPGDPCDGGEHKKK
jgi:hypothetical protein